MSTNRDQNRLPLPANPPAYLEDEEMGDTTPLPQYERYEARPPGYTPPVGSPERSGDRIQRHFSLILQEMCHVYPLPEEHDDRFRQLFQTLERLIREDGIIRPEELENTPLALKNPITVGRRIAAAALRREREVIIKRIEEIKRAAYLQKEMDEMIQKVTDVFQQFKNYWKPRDRDDEGSAGGAPASSSHAAAYFGY